MSGILGQLSPLAATLTDLYTCPAKTVATMRVIITNRVAVASTFRVAIAKAGAVDSVEQYVAYDKAIAASDTGSTIGFALSSGDIVRVYSSSGLLSFTATGETRAE